jgi:hypothetical protein
LKKYRMNQMPPPRPARRCPAAVTTHDNVKIGDGIGSPVCRPDVQPATEIACWV